MLLFRFRCSIQQPGWNDWSYLCGCNVSRAQHPHQPAVRPYGLHLPKFILRRQGSQAVLLNHASSPATRHSSDQPRGQFPGSDWLNSNDLILRRKCAARQQNERKCTKRSLDSQRTPQTCGLACGTAALRNGISPAFSKALLNHSPSADFKVRSRR